MMLMCLRNLLAASDNAKNKKVQRMRVEIVYFGTDYTFPILLYSGSDITFLRDVSTYLPNYTTSREPG
jgi:hypothetical protein